MTHFFYRFDCMNLVPGNKSAGFVMQVSTSALIALSKIRFTGSDRAALLLAAHARIRNAKLLSARAVNSAAINFYEESACPRVFTADPVFSGSIGADPETFGRLSRPDVYDWVGPIVDYTPHNVDAPQTALAIFLLAQTWAEWASHRLLAITP